MAMNREYRKPTDEEKDVLKPDIKSFVQDRLSDAKDVINKTEGDIKEFIRDLTARPKKTIDESKEFLKGYGDWFKSSVENLESVVESVVRQTIKVFSPLQPLQKNVDDLEKRAEKLSEELARLLATKNKQPPVTQ